MNDQKIYDWSHIEAKFNNLVNHSYASSAWFYRHGETNYNRRGLVSGQHDTKLTDIGLEQAAKIRPTLPNHFDLIVCSRLKRTMQTMRLAIPEEIFGGTEFYQDIRLNEVSLGVLQGKRKRSLDYFDDGDIDFAPAYGETYRQAAQRTFSATLDIFEKLSNCDTGQEKTAVVFCHAGIMRILSSLTKDLDCKALFKESHTNSSCLKLFGGKLALPEFWQPKRKTP